MCFHVDSDSKEFMGNFWESIAFFFQAMKNAIVLCQYMLFCNFDLLMNQKVGNWVKAHNII
jgi:hypothetical protein